MTPLQSWKAWLSILVGAMAISAGAAVIQRSALIDAAGRDADFALLAVDGVVDRSALSMDVLANSGRLRDLLATDADPRETVRFIDSFADAVAPAFREIAIYGSDGRLIASSNTHPELPAIDDPTVLDLLSRVSGGRQKATVGTTASGRPDASFLVAAGVMGAEHVVIGFVARDTLLDPLRATPARLDAGISILIGPSGRIVWRSKGVGALIGRPFADDPALFYSKVASRVPVPDLVSELGLQADPRYRARIDQPHRSNLVLAYVLPRGAIDGMTAWTFGFSLFGGLVIGAAALALLHPTAPGSGMPWARNMAPATSGAAPPVTGSSGGAAGSDAGSDAGRTAATRRLARSLVGLASWEIDPLTETVLVDEGFSTVFGLAATGSPPTVSLAAWRATVVPDDLVGIHAACLEAQAGPASARISYRIVRPDNGETRLIETSISAISQPDGSLRIAGVSFDITEREQAAAARTATIRHRSRSLLAVIQSLVHLSRDFASDNPEAVPDRISALTRADAILSESDERGTLLRSLIEAEIGAHVGASRVGLLGPDLRIAPAQVEPLALAIHELMTNALRHGALTRITGRVTVTWETDADGRLVIRWRERGGPLVGEPDRKGFGSTILHLSVVEQMAGARVMEWLADGLVATLVLPIEIEPGDVLPAQIHPTHGPKDPEPDALSGRRILVLEDQALVGAEIKSLLETAGSTVIGPATRIETADALIAAETMADHRIDAALLDVCLADRCTSPLARRLEEIGIRIVVQAADPERLLEWRAHVRPAAVLLKPVTPRDLTRAMAQALAEHPSAA